MIAVFHEKRPEIFGKKGKAVLRIGIIGKNKKHQKCRILSVFLKLLD
jgi:hypothetical protein